jgi:hypothetical protein
MVVKAPMMTFFDAFEKLKVAMFLDRKESM